MGLRVPSMNTDERKGHLRAHLMLIGASVLCILLFALFFDLAALVSDAASAARVRWELPRARERWEASNAANYQIHVKGAVPLGCIVDADLTVLDGRLLVPESPLVQVQPAEWEGRGCPYEALTVEGMFTRVATSLRGVGLLGTPLNVEFDDQRGFVTEYRFGRASGGGVFGPTVSDCCTWFQFDSFIESPP
jgi:hypothetical protein